MECSQCKKKNEPEANFCIRCGYDIAQLKLDQCSICLEEKKLEVLICGHKCCLTCMESQFKIKKECPECRKELSRCQSCSSFRVLITNNTEKCLQCHKEVKLNYEDSNSLRFKCVECQSKRLLYNHVSDSWNCLDCFHTFTRSNGQIRVNTSLNSTTTICVKCFSNNLKADDNFDMKCLHCLTENVKTKTISLEEYSCLKVKDKEEVNPCKRKKCIDCESDKIFEQLDINGFDKIYYCHSCNKQNVRVY